ncbi:nucleotide pyrophosphohydrolase [Halomonas sp. DX6]|uniref:Nucleotide pyrophosphohydrolase n=2 Tax=Billgrantia bachuensis TaxID=2717286 RepID=A0ABX0PSZ3_9GAMM|nr:nucleotide pyrophosphohydrolase [Halomonas bachuensis]
MCEAWERLEQIVGFDTGSRRVATTLNAVEQITKGLSFHRMRLANVTRQQEWPGYDQTDTTFKALEVCGEAGELAEAVKKMVRAERGIAGSTAKLEAVADELGDVIISADLLAAHLGIDLASAVAKKFDKTSVKYGLETRLGAAEEEPEA